MELKNIEGTSIYEFHSKGKLTEKDAEKLNEAFEEFEKNGQKISLLGIMEELPMPEDFAAVGDTLKLKSSGTRVIEKYAILTDRKWLHKLISAGDFITPNMPIKAFEIDNKQAAIDWLKTENLKEYDSEDFNSNIDVRKLNSNVYEVTIPGEKVNLAAMTSVYEFLKKEDKVNLLVIFQTFPSFDSVKAFAEGLKIDLKAIGKIEKYGIVSDAKWIKEFSKIGDFIVPTLDMKYFEMKDVEKARAWVMEN